jgi:hypothetical protein
LLTWKNAAGLNRSRDLTSHSLHEVASR